MPETASDPVTDLREVVAGLPDGTIRGLVRLLVRAIVHGMAEEISDCATAAILGRLEEAAADTAAVERVDLAEDDAVDLDAAVVAKPHTRHRDEIHRTCEVCGREGSRRFVETASGWKCAPTATACPGNRAAEPASDIVAKPFPPKVAPPPASLPPGVTARCTDCTRTWILTGIPLKAAVDAHEARTAHIVAVDEGATTDA